MTWPAAPPRPDSHVGATVAAVFAGIWVVTVAFVSQSGGWLTTQILLALGLDQPGYFWPIIAIVSMLAAGGPAMALALIPRHPAIREAGRAWAIGAGALGLGTGLRAIPGTENEWYLFALAAWAGVGALVFRRNTSSARYSVTWWGFIAGVIVLTPFVWAGALGGWTDTLLAILAAAAVGALAASMLDDRVWASYAASTARRVVVGGLVAGVALTLLAAGAGGNGVQILLIFVLPPLGFAAAALKSAWPLIGLAALGPLAFIDPVEVNLFLLNRDVPFWAATASAAAWVLALLVGLVLLASRLVANRPIAIGTAVVVALGAGAVYAIGGQPGFFGDQLFVVLKEQAPLEGLPTTTGVGPGRDARVAAVYRRLVEHAERTQAPLRKELDRFKLDYQPYYLVNAIRVDGGPAIRAWLELREDVDRVLLDQRLRPLPVPLDKTVGDITSPPTSPEWNLEMVGAPDVWPQGQGSGIVVGSSDSGVDGRHPALASGYRGGEDSWYDPWNGTDFPVDNGGHGTHTLGTAVGKQRVGVAPQAQWVGCVNLDRNMGSPSFYLDCMQFMLAPFAKGGNPFKDGRPGRAPHVLTNSWGCPPLEGCDIDVMRPATDAIAAAGIAFVAAAGNAGDRCGSIDVAPAVDPAAFTVAAVNEQRAVTGFSSRGQPASGKPDASAPGEQVLSAMPGNTYGVLDGTSMATPHVAGVIALIWSIRPELVGDVEGTYGLLRRSATPVTSAPTCGDLEDGGAGIVNAERALALAGR